MQVLDSLFWLLFSTSFVLLGVFPDIACVSPAFFGVYVCLEFRFSIRDSRLSYVISPFL
ncbi:MAG: hypothetical protein ACLU37_05335 [Collinsella sp.]